MHPVLFSGHRVLYTEQVMMAVIAMNIFSWIWGKSCFITSLSASWSVCFTCHGLCCLCGCQQLRSILQGHLWEGLHWWAWQQQTPHEFEVSSISGHPCWDGSMTCQYRSIPTSPDYWLYWTIPLSCSDIFPKDLCSWHVSRFVFLSVKFLWNVFIFCKQIKKFKV